MRTSRTTELPDPTLVIGLGNSLMDDDSLGLVALERLRSEWELPPEVELVDGGTWGMNLLPMIEDANRVLLIDAIQAGCAPGTAIELVGDAVPTMLSQKLSPHQIDLREVLAVAMLRSTLPRELVAIGIQPLDVEMGTELSAPVANTIPGLVIQIVRRLRSFGHRCEPRVSVVYA